MNTSPDDPSPGKNSVETLFNSHGNGLCAMDQTIYQKKGAEPTLDSPC